MTETSETPEVTETSDRKPVTLYRAVQAEGARIAFVSCLTCGAALFFDPEDDIDVVAIHVNWHEAKGDVVHYRITHN